MLAIFVQARGEPDRIRKFQPHGTHRRALRRRHQTGQAATGRGVERCKGKGMGSFRVQREQQPAREGIEHEWREGAKVRDDNIRPLVIDAYMKSTAAIICFAIAGSILLTTTAHAGPPMQMRKPRPQQEGSDYEKRADVIAYMDELVLRYGFDRKILRKTFARVKAQPAALRAMTLPVTQPPKWYEYEPQLVNEERTERGVRFWH